MLPAGAILIGWVVAELRRSALLLIVALALVVLSYVAVVMLVSNRNVTQSPTQPRLFLFDS